VHLHAWLLWVVLVSFLMFKIVLLYFELAHISNTRGFRGGNSFHVYSVLWKCLPPPLYSHSSSSPLSLLYTVWWSHFLFVFLFGSTRAWTQGLMLVRLTS
jgi:hypothetical protein